MFSDLNPPGTSRTTNTRWGTFLETKFELICYFTTLWRTDGENYASTVSGMCIDAGSAAVNPRSEAVLLSYQQISRGPRGG